MQRIHVGLSCRPRISQSKEGLKALYTKMAGDRDEAN
jgi:hypothetical protein